MQQIIFVLVLLFGFMVKPFSQVVPQSNAINSIESIPVPKEAEVPAEINEQSKRSSSVKKMESPPVETKSTGQADQSVYSSAQQKQQLTFQLQSTISKFRTSTTSRSPEISEQERIVNLVNQLENADNQSFEYHYFKYVSGNYDFSLLPHLHQAQRLKPDNLDVLVQLGAYYWITQADKKALEVTEKLFKRARLDESLKQYAHDVLISVPENGTLITHGVEDTYAILYVQKKEGIRADVNVFSLDWFQNLQFREFANSKYFELPKSNHIDVNYLKQLCELNPSKILALSFTIPSNYFKPIKSMLFVHGLVAVYTGNPQNLNFEVQNMVLFDKFNNHLVSTPPSQRSAELMANYLPMLITLRSSITENNLMAEQLDELIEKIKASTRSHVSN